MKKFAAGMSRIRRGLRLACGRVEVSAEKRGYQGMKYILLMSGTKAGVDTYRAWSKKDIDAHMAVLVGINRELTESGEFMSNAGVSRL